MRDCPGILEDGRAVALLQRGLRLHHPGSAAAAYEPGFCLGIRQKDQGSLITDLGTGFHPSLFLYLSISASDEASFRRINLYPIIGCCVWAFDKSQ